MTLQCTSMHCMFTACTGAKPLPFPGPLVPPRQSLCLPAHDAAQIGNWNRGAEYANDIIDDLQNWAVGWTDWCAHTMRVQSTRDVMAGISHLTRKAGQTGPATLLTRPSSSTATRS